MKSYLSVWLHFVCENAITNFRAERERKKEKSERERKGGARLTRRNFKLRRCNVR